MDVDTPEQRGENRPVEEVDGPGPPKPKRIKVGEHQLIKLPSPNKVPMELTMSSRP